ncbi:uncharacterized protein EI90DRAFT_3068551 [Cantharellus anzutake]|uniref:uncharacterized protein n=1 Tax=Cantharellus anzutake TaxID=1750568 RepID=UPI0019081D9C|nr:uncharacterized protein EI90DRAFT_3068551 [Cantharellus anzutake]KAF8327278.1 hypothetical protein EI90DRAFT_3068551 [Cantharellus anzutake]
MKISPALGRLWNFGVYKLWCLPFPKDRFVALYEKDRDRNAFNAVGAQKGLAHTRKFEDAPRTLKLYHSRYRCNDAERNAMRSAWVFLVSMMQSLLGTDR